MLFGTAGAVCAAAAPEVPPRRPVSADPAGSLREVLRGHRAVLGDAQVDPVGDLGGFDGQVRPGDRSLARAHRFEKLAIHQRSVVGAGRVQRRQRARLPVLTEREHLAVLAPQTSLSPSITSTAFGSGYRFADGFGVSGVILLPLDVRLHVGQAASVVRMP